METSSRGRGLAFGHPGYQIEDVPNIEIKGDIKENCVACSFAGAMKRIVVPGAPGAKRRVFEYIFCPACGSLHLHDKLTEGQSSYSEGYYSFAIHNHSRLKQFVRSLNNRIILFDNTFLHLISSRYFPFPAYLSLRPLFNGDLGGRYTPENSVLDVGCGNGSKLVGLREAGFKRLAGVDPHLPGEIALPGIRLIRGTIDSVDEPFDIVMFHHSFEHMEDPREALKVLHRRVRPGGVAVIRIPVLGGWAWRTRGGEWPQLDAPRHVHLYSQAGFERLAGQTRWQVVKTLYDSGPAQFARALLDEEGAALVREEVEPRRLREQKRQANLLNRSNDGDQATFFLFPEGDREMPGSRA